MVGPFLTGLRDGTDPRPALRRPGAVPAARVRPRHGRDRSSPTSSRSARRARSSRGRGWPRPPHMHPFDHPFAFALIRLDGADTTMIHAVDAGSIDAMSHRACGSPPSTATSASGAVTDVYFVPEADAVAQDIDAGRRAGRRSPRTSSRLDINETLTPAPPALRRGPGRGAAHRPAVAGERQGLRPEPRATTPWSGSR